MILLFQVVDMYFISLLGTAPLAAVSFTFPVTFTVMSLAFGLAIGTGAIVAPTLGRGDTAQARRLTTDSLLLATLLVTCLATIGVLTIKPLFTLLAAPADILSLIELYIWWWYLAVGFIVIPIVGNSAIRATGDTRSPTVVMSIAGLLNAVLDPLLIFGIGPFPRLEIEGAAIATMLSWIFTFIASLWILSRWKNLLTCTIPSWQMLWQSWATLLRIGIPAATVSMLQPISLALVMMMVVSYGAEAVAGFGVGARTEALFMLVINAVAMVLPAFIGQNFGAGQMSRVTQAVGLAIRFSVLFQLGVYSVLLVTAPWLAGLFSDDPAVIAATIWFWWIIPVSYGALGILSIVSAAFNALHKPMYSLVLNLVRLFVLYIPLAYLGAHWYGLTGLFMGCALANLIAGALAYGWVKSLCHRYECAAG